MKIAVAATEEFCDWLESLPAKYEAQIRKRLLAIEIYGHFGDFKSLGNGLFELRWKNGRRIYFARTAEWEILISGGLKNEQEKQIKKARTKLRKHADYGN